MFRYTRIDMFSDYRPAQTFAGKSGCPGNPPVTSTFMMAS